MRLEISKFLVALVIVSALVLNGCSAPEANSDTSTATENTTQSTTNTTTEAAPVSDTKKESNIMKNLPRLEGKATVVMTVKGSPITIEVDGVNAPITAGNFVDLVQKGVYDGLAFHRVIGPTTKQDPFVAQGGDPKSKDPKVPLSQLGAGSYIDTETGTARYIPLEITAKGEKEPTYSQTLPKSKPPELRHTLGAVAMARSQMSDSASSQFYFALADLGFLDGNYAVFGYVTDGMDVVNKIDQGDRIDSAKVTKGAENLKQPGK
ncbi:MAG: peptidylprolyl isomerase [Calothrix sp. MO_167.B12]|nr:peptidylprolyl isomerase [Calothrix sp. MO_167.B12]